VKRVVTVALALALAPAGARAAEAVFVGSARYDIIVGLSYTRETSPEGEQGGFSRYTSVGRFENVKFGPSPSPEFAAWFEVRVGPPEAGAAMPMNQVSGRGEITDFTIAPAWEDPNEAIEPKITAGPEPFEPVLQLLTFEMAHDAEPEEARTGEGIPNAPLVPTLWFMYSENFSVDGSELRWEYEEFALGAVEGSAVRFSVALGALAEGEDVELSIPFTDGAAKGEWTIQFQAQAEGQ